MDREYESSAPIPDWLKHFADNNLKKDANLFDDIKELFKSKDNLDDVEARVAELRERVGLDFIEKQATYSGPIEEETIENKNFRKVLFTGKNSQLVLMSLKGGEEIGMETHKDIDQFFRVEEGEAIFVLNGKEQKIKADEAIIIPAGTKHNVINASKTEPLKIYTIYSPPNHPPKTIDETKEDAEEREKKTAEQIMELITLAQAFEDEGLNEEARCIDEKVKSMMEANDKEVKELPKKYEKYEGLDEFIQNACRTSGGFASVHAIKDRIRKEFDEKIDINKDLEKYIKFCLEEHKEHCEENNQHAGEYIAIIVTDDVDENNRVFDEEKANIL